MACCNVCLRDIFSAKDQVTVMDVKTNETKTSLIMEGGAMRGLFTCGIIDVFMENGISFDAAAGISAGAIFGTNYKSGQIGRPLRYNVRFSKDPRYGSIRSWLKTGDLYDVDFCYREIPDVLDPFDRKSFAENPMIFYIGATDVETGKPVYHKCSDGGDIDMQWIRASASLPGVSRPVTIEGRTLLDGGISDSVPFEFMESIGYNRNVIILTQPKGYRKTKSKLVLFMKMMLRKYPNVYRAIVTRHEMYNRQMDEIDKRETEGTALVLRPEEALGISRTESDPSELERVYKMGREVGEKALPRVKEFLVKQI